MADLFPHAGSQEAEGRRRQMLRTAFGPAIAAALADPTVIEVMANPDGKLWIESIPAGRRDSGERIGAAEAERIIRLVAAHVRREVTDKAPIVSAELPDTGERFEGVMPPVATAPCFSIRKPAQVLYRLSDYVAQRIMTPPQAQLLRQAVTDRRNIVVVGGTSSGKTTLVNALLAEVASLDERVLILEDTRELQCAAEDAVSLRTKPGVASLADLVRSTLRLRPDRIIVGEVRGPEALDMLKAWNTGHPGGQLRPRRAAQAGAAGARGRGHRAAESIEGPVAKVSAVVIIILTGLSLAFGDMGGGIRRLVQIVFGLSIAFAATSFFLTFFSFAGGALID